MNATRRMVLLSVSGLLQQLMKSESPEIRAEAAEENVEIARRLKEGMPLPEIQPGLGEVPAQAA